jgi:hypothetical protein
MIDCIVYIALGAALTYLIVWLAAEWNADD